MLKTKDDPTMCMKTQGHRTKCPATTPAFLHKLGGNRREFVAFMGRDAHGTR